MASVRDVRAPGSTASLACVMDPDGCLVSQSPDGTPLPFLGPFVYTCSAFLVVALIAQWITHGVLGGSAPSVADLASGVPRYGMTGAATVYLLVKLCFAFTLPQLAAFGALTAINDGGVATPLADMACNAGSAFPVLTAIFGSVVVLVVITNPLRLCNRHALAVAAVGDSAPRVGMVLPAGRGVFVAPLAAACLKSSARTGDAAGDPPRLTLLACDAFGTPHCPDSSAWLRHNVANGLLRDPTTAAALDMGVHHVEFTPGAEQQAASCALPAATGTVDLVLAPFLWTTRSDAAPGESAAARADRLYALLLEARRVLAPGGRLVTIAPFFRARAAREALEEAEFDGVRSLPGLHWLSFLPSKLVEARVPHGGDSSDNTDVATTGVAAAASSVAAVQHLHPTAVHSYRGLDCDNAGGGWVDGSVDATPAPSSLATLSSPWTARRVQRALVYAAALLIGCGGVAILVFLLSRHWQQLSSDVVGPAPGLPFSVRLAAVSLSLQINLPTGLLLLLDAAWTAACVRDEAAARTAAKCDNRKGSSGGSSDGSAQDVNGGSRGVSESLLGESIDLDTGGVAPFTLASDVQDVARCLLFAVVGSIVINLIQWAPVFAFDMAWLAASPPSSQSSMHTVNIVIAALLPFVLIQVAAACMGGGAKAAANKTAAGSDLEDAEV